MKVSRELWGFSEKGEKIYLFRLEASSGACIELTNLGATWISAIIPDEKGRLDDVLLGYKSPEGYMMDTFYMGSTIGRFANRIAGAGFRSVTRIFIWKPMTGPTPTMEGIRVSIKKPGIQS